MKKLNLWLVALIAIVFFSSCDKLGLNEVVVTEDISTSTTWSSKKTYVIDGYISVGENQVLTIEAGTKIKFENGGGIMVGYSNYGTIKAIGTEKDPIIFTSNASVKSKGDWEGIYFYEGANGCEFEFCTFEYGGGYSGDGLVNIDDTEVSFKNCTFTESENYGIVADGGGFTAFDNNTITETKSNPIVIDADFAHTIGTDNVIEGSGIYVDAVTMEVPGTYTWRKLTVPYILDGYMGIGSEQGAVVLDIEPGTTIMMNSGAEIAIGDYNRFGTINANGTAEEPITFTSSSAYPDNGDWDGFWFYEGTKETVFNYCVISYAGGYGDDYGNINIKEDSGSEITISNTLISYSAAYGIYLNNDTDPKPTLTNVTYSNNTLGDINWTNK